jgi:hypothetical protein
LLKKPENSYKAKDEGYYNFTVEMGDNNDEMLE